MTAIDHDPTFERPAAPRLDRSTVTGRIIYSWFHMRRATRTLITERPHEARLLEWVLWTNLFFFASWALRAVLVPRPESLDLLSVEIGTLFVAVMLGRTAFLYFMAMFLGAFCRLIGGRGTWRNTRIAVFWADVVTIPFGVVAALCAVAFTNLAEYYTIFEADWIALPPYWFGIIPTVYFTAAGLAQAHGFAKTAPVFLYLSLGSLVALLLALYLHANGVF